MNLLAIDYGKKRVGFAVSVSGIIETLPVLANDQNLFGKIKEICHQYQISKVYIGLSEGKFADETKAFVKRLSPVLELPLETVEEAVSTIEADEIYLRNSKKKKLYKTTIDSVAAAVILRRIVG